MAPERGEAETTLDGQSATGRERPEDQEVTTVGDEIPLAERSHPDLIVRGQKIGRFVVIERLGAGAMGTVYRAYDPELDRGIALKLVEVRKAQGRRAAEVRIRIMREAQAIARMQHPNVVQVFDVGDVEHAVWVAMEFIDGLTIKEWSREKTRPWRETVDAFVQAGRGLAAAHAADVVHRDFKPDNVMIGNDGRVRVLDFGLARALGDPTTRESSRVDLADLEELPAEVPLDASLTAQGIVMGTPAYMAPEQHLGGGVDAQSDQFAFCVSLWEALYGQRPFLGETHATIAFAATRGKIAAPPSDRGVPRRINALLRRGLSPSARDRYASMQALIEDLERDPARRRRRIATGVGVIVVATLAAVGTRALGPQEPPPLCQGARDKLAGVWDEGRRAQLRDAFGNTGLSFAGDALHRTEAIIDDWTERWVLARREACEATQVHGEQSTELMDLRMACLDRLRLDLEALTDELVQAAPGTVQRATQAAAQLPAIRPCGDVQYLTARVPAPTDPARKQEVDRLTAELAQLRAHVNTVGYATAPDKVAALRSAVTKLDHAPVTTHFLGLAAQVELNTGEAKAARITYEEALGAALRSGDMRRAAYFAARLVFVVGHRLSNPEGGETWARIGQPLVAATGHDGNIQASLWAAVGTMRVQQGDLDRGQALQEKVRDYWLDNEPRASELGVAYGNLGIIAGQRGEFEEAVRLHALEIEVIAEAYGPLHPETASSQARYAQALSFANRHEEAKDIFHGAIERLRESTNDSNFELATALDGLGRALRKLGDVDGAVAAHREALGQWRAELGNDHPDVGISLMQIGYTLAAKEAWSEALGVFDEAAAVFERAGEVEHSRQVYVANSRATMHLMLGAPTRALPIIETALALEGKVQADPTLFAETRFVLAQALWDAETDRPRALTLARTAAETYAKGSEVWKTDLDKIRAWLAERE